jgi:tRNA-dihydrouridine synthase A
MQSLHPYSPWRFSVAPMMEWTDRHCRAFHRAFSRHALLYSEMVTAGAVIHGDRERLIGFSPDDEGRVALQLGGNDPAQLAQAAKIGEEFGYAEINLNCGCPSDRVQGGAFGACLMREPVVVGECVAAMKAAVAIPVTVKCRIGVDDQDAEVALDDLAASVKSANCDALIVHARKAWLQGLSPKENRDVPPLDYERAYRLKRRFPEWPVAINGGIIDPRDWHTHLVHLDGVMIGREAYQNPEILLKVDPDLFGQSAPQTDVLAALTAHEEYMAQELAKGTRLHSMTRHMMGLFPGRAGARMYRRYLSTEGVKPLAGLAIWQEALAHVTSRWRDDAEMAA